MTEEAPAKLPTEARPIPLTELTNKEKELVTRINSMMWDIAEDAKKSAEESRKRDHDEWINPNRTGRVLLIDGPRGSGKSSLLLTLLKEWDPDGPASDTTGLREELNFTTPSLRQLVFLKPPLDFDPLPPGMPLHGWLLLPWQRLAQKYAEQDSAMNLEEPLLDRWTTLFESAVISWNGAATGGKSVVERALAFQDQALGWHSMGDDFRSFVERVSFSSLKSGARKHSRATGYGNQDVKCSTPVYVIAIDDVDLQVERLPELLHAIRLLSHPSVVYLLTAHYEHLKFVIQLDYLRQHCALASTSMASERLKSECNSHSETLAAALMAKALPRLARFSLDELSFAEVCTFQVPESETIGAMVNKLADEPGRDDKAIADRTDLRKTLSEATNTDPPLPFLLARQAQHALDYWRRQGSDRTALSLLRNLIDPSTDGDHRPELLQIQGSITTDRPRPSWRVSTGKAHIFAAGKKPRLVFIDSETEVRNEGSAATRALLAQVLVDHRIYEAPSLHWDPDAGMVWTEYEWKKERLVFHWPWLNEPRASTLTDRYSEWGALATELNKTYSHIPTLLGATLLVWVRLNLHWDSERENRFEYSIDQNQNQEDFRKSLVDALAETAKRAKDAKKTDVARETKNSESRPRAERKGRPSEELTRWMNELALLAAPYYGLPDTFSEALLDSLLPQPPRESDLKLKDILDEEERVFSTALSRPGMPLPTETTIRAQLDAFRSNYRKDNEGHPWVKRIPPESRRRKGLSQS